MNLPHILVVEDEEHLAELIEMNLRAEGYRVTLVEEGHEALEIIERDAEGIDLVVLDLMLPGMSGYAVCEELRAGGRDTPILILSARTLPEDRARGFEAGANQYMMKPFDLHEFLSRVKNLLAPPGGKQRDPERANEVGSAEFGRAKVNFNTPEAVVDGQPVRLTSLEMKLLRYFVRNEGRVIPRGELLENVWGSPAHLTTRAPDQFIRRLRKYFEPNPAKPVHFLTLRDAGYRFVAEPANADS